MGNSKELVVRTISGTAFVLAVIICCLCSHWTVFAMTFIFMTMLLWEFTHLAGTRKLQRILVFTTCCTLLVAYFLYTWDIIEAGWLLVPVFPLCALIVSNLFVSGYNVHDGKPNGFDSIGYEFMAIAYIAVPSMLVCNAVTMNYGFSGYFLLSLFIMLWSCDVGAYCIGTAFGQKKTSRKLFPSVSPKKSWAGFWGGVACTVIAAIILWKCSMLETKLVYSIMISLVVAVGAIFGDLVESQLKRNFGVKDSSHIIPGHGGMLDRLDGSLIAFPAAIALAILLGII